eukprot:scaffold128026_cov28-Prasinocladus_malaysianus.AAC.1
MRADNIATYSAKLSGHSCPDRSKATRLRSTIATPNQPATTSHVMLGINIGTNRQTPAPNAATLPATIPGMAGQKRKGPENTPDSLQTPAKKMRRPPDTLEEVVTWMKTILPNKDDQAQAEKMIRQEDIDGEALLGMQPDEIQPVLRLESTFAREAFQKALADLQGQEPNIGQGTATKIQPAVAVCTCPDTPMASTPDPAPLTPSLPRPSMPEYETWREPRGPPSAVQVAEWITAASAAESSTWKPSVCEKIQKVLIEQNIDAKALCLLDSPVEVMTTFKLSEDDANKLWAKVQVLKLLARQSPWGYPS